MSTDKSLKKLIAQILRSRFARNVAIVASGTAGAQVITMAFAPLITRIYGPEAFGVQGTFLAIVTIVIPLAALSYPIAIVLPKDDADALGIAWLSLLIAVVMAAATTLIFLVFREPIITLLSSEVISGFIFLIPLAMLCSVSFAVMDQWVLRKKLFKIKAKIAVAGSLVLNSAKVGFGLVNPVAAVLVVLSVVGSLLHALMLIFSVRRVARSSPMDRPQAATLAMLAKRHRDFPLYRTPQIFLNSLSQSLPTLMLASFFGVAAAGFYTLSRSVLGLPSTLIGNSVGDVFYPRISEAARCGQNLTILIVKATLALALVGFLPYSLLIAFAPLLFGLVFGHEWAMAGEYARWLALWLFAMFLNNPSVKALPVLAAQRFHLVFTCLTIVIRVSALFIGYYFFESDLISVALFGISGMLLNILLILAVIYLSRQYDRRVFAGA